MIHLTNITRQHGARVLFRDASFQILPGSRSGLVGPNGAGKSTIFRLITGEEDADGGDISCSKKTVIGYFSQEVGDMAGRSALGEVMAASARTMHLGEQIQQMEAAMAEPMEDDALAALLERYGEAQEEFEHRGGYDLEARAQAVLTGLGIGPDDYDRPVESFSGGWKMRIALAKILTDEPANGLDPEGMRWLRTFLRARAAEGKTILVSSHVLTEVEQTVDDVLIISNGRLVAKGSLASLGAGVSPVVRLRSPQAELLQRCLHERGAAVNRLDDALAIRGPSAPEVGEAAHDCGAVLHELLTERPSLEDLFLEIAGTRRPES